MLLLQVVDNICPAPSPQSIRKCLIIFRVFLIPYNLRLLYIYSWHITWYFESTSEYDTDVPFIFLQKKIKNHNLYQASDFLTVFVATPDIFVGA